MSKKHLLEFYLKDISSFTVIFINYCVIKPAKGSQLSFLPQ